MPLPFGAYARAPAEEEGAHPLLMLAAHHSVWSQPTRLSCEEKNSLKVHILLAKRTFKGSLGHFITTQTQNVTPYLYCLDSTKERVALLSQFVTSRIKQHRTVFIKEAF